MTKQDVIRQITERTGLDPLVSRSVLESFFKVVKSALAEGEPIYIRTFGSFLVKQRAGKIARNIRQNKVITLAAHKIPAFKPSAEFSNQVRAQLPTKEKGKQLK